MMCLPSPMTLFFFFNDTATTEIYTLSYTTLFRSPPMNPESLNSSTAGGRVLGSTEPAPLLVLAGCWGSRKIDRKSTRLNSSHSQISYAVFCLKKKRDHSEVDVVKSLAQHAVARSQ